jgi:hypothetical protein
MSNAAEVQEVPTGTLADPSGLSPAQLHAGERQQFDAVRADFDTPLQVARITPAQPQERQTVDDYRRGLLYALSKHADVPLIPDARYVGQANLPEVQRRIVQGVMTAPHRAGELREVLHVDRSGRAVREFHGVKSWMRPYQATGGVSGIYAPADPIRGTPAKPLRIPTY